MRLSVIICIYNAAQYIEDCVGRLLPQVDDDMELLLLDDGSNDASSELCDKTAKEDSRVKVMHLPHNCVSKTRQIGLEIAKGKYILYVDADDVVAPTMIDDLLQVADKDNADMVICDYKELTTDGDVYRKQQPSAMDGETILDDILTGRLYGALWNKLMRREWLIQSNARFPDQLNMREDLVFLSQCLPTAKHLAYLPKALYGYNRRNINALTNNYLKENSDYYIQETLWVGYILDCQHLKIATRQHLLEYFSELAYTTLRQGLFDRQQWNSRFMANKDWVLQGHDYKRELVKMALNGHYSTASLLRSIIAKVR